MCGQEERKIESQPIIKNKPAASCVRTLPFPAYREPALAVRDESDELALLEVPDGRVEAWVRPIAAATWFGLP